MKNILILGVFLILMNCTMSPQDKIDHNEFQELHKHKGSENYELVELFDKKFEIRNDILVDKQNQNLVVKGFKEQKLEDKNLHIFKKITNLGEEIDEFENVYKMLKDGAIKEGDRYINWVINGDTTRHKFIDPFSNEKIEKTYKYKINEKDPEKWLEKFKELYAKAQYIYIKLLF